MHQIIAYRMREVANKKDTNKKEFKSVALWTQDTFSCPSIAEMLLRPVHYLAQLPESERDRDIHITVSEVYSGKHGENSKTRQLKSQKVIPFDIDHMHFENETEEGKRKYCLDAARVACDGTGINFNRVGVVCSGNGMHIYAEIPEPWTTEEYFEEHRAQYAAICAKMTASLNRGGFPGVAERGIFMPSKTLRFPNTWNDKTHKGQKRIWSFVVKHSLSPQEWDWEKLSGLKLEPYSDATISRAKYKSLYAHTRPDTEAVLSGCEFLKWCKDAPAQVNEEQWYAMLGVVGFLSDEDDLAHTYSMGHPGYSEHETTFKLNNHRKVGPRTCKDIDRRWGKCSGCPHYNKIASPILITGPNHIKTKNTDFRRVLENGRLSARVEVKDLARYFREQNTVKSFDTSQCLYTYTGSYWREVSDKEVRAIMQSYLIDEALDPDMRLCVQAVKDKSFASGREKEHFFLANRKNLVNFRNGTYNWKTNVFREHQMDDGFPFILPYDYEPDAKAPLFESFMDEITSGDQEVKKTLLQYMGYCISGDDYWERKALWLYGHGKNGKGTLVKTLRAVVGDENVAAVDVSRFADQQSLIGLKNKLININEELNVFDAIKHEGMIKRLTDMDLIEVKKVYHEKETLRSIAKLIFTSNERPEIADTSYGIARRYVLVELKKQFIEKDDKFLLNKLTKELSGIFNILISAYRDMLEAGELFEAESIKRAVKEIRLESNDVALFARDCLIPCTDQNKWAPVHETYLRYNEYCKEGNYRVRSKVKFVKILYNIEGGVYVPTLVRKEDKVVRCIEGFRLTDGTEEEISGLSPESVGF